MVGPRVPRNRFRQQRPPAGRCLRGIIALAIAICLAGAAAGPLKAEELQTRYTKVIYQDIRQLQRFSDKITSPRLTIRPGNHILATDEIAARIDALVEKMEKILEIAPRRLQFTISLHDNQAAIRAIYAEIYHQDVDFKAFYAPKNATVYVSLSDLKLVVLAHEIAHVIIDFHFVVSPSVTIHEVLAQYAASQLLRDP